MAENKVSHHIAELFGLDGGSGIDSSQLLAQCRASIDQGSLINTLKSIN